MPGHVLIFCVFLRGVAARDDALIYACFPMAFTLSCSPQRLVIMDASNGRLYSLDALRGLDMLCIAGLELLVWALAASFPDSTALQWCATQFGHRAWEGLTLYDLIFPLFVFLAGVSMSFSLSKGGAAAAVAWRLLRRAALLIILGWAVNGVITLDGSMRYASVLGLIGMSCLFGGLVCLLAGWRGAAVTALLLLVTVGVLQCGYGELTPAGSINAHLDQMLLPGRLHYGSYDPEGVLCIVSAVAMNLLGLLSGVWLRHASGSLSRVLGLVLTGAVFFVLGYYVLPEMGYACVKNIWTSSFVLAAAGISMTLLALFHLLVDVLPGGALVSFPLRVIGMNALVCYLLTHVVDFAALTNRLFSGVCRLVLPADLQRVALAGAFILLIWWILYLFYRRRVFFKV